VREGLPSLTTIKKKKILCREERGMGQASAGTPSKKIVFCKEEKEASAQGKKKGGTSATEGMGKKTRRSKVRRKKWGPGASSKFAKKTC